MNRKQKTAILIGVILIAASGVYPPWLRTYQRPGAPRSYTVGPRAFFWSPPQEAGYRGFPLYGVGLDQRRLGWEWAGIGILTAGTVLLLGEGRQGRRKRNRTTDDA